MENLEETVRYIREGKLKTRDIIHKVENEFKRGETTAEMFAFTVKYMNLLDRIAKNENELIDIEELVDLGFYDSVEEIKDIINENYDEFKHSVFNKPCIYPEPTDEEINQYVDSDNDEKVCIVCFHRRRHTVCIPCGHLAMCTVCCKDYVEKSTCDINCPICRKKVTKFQKIFT